MSLDRLVKLRFIFPYYCPHFWPQGSLLKWKARDAPVTWLSPLLLPYSNPTRSHLPPETGSDSNLITYVSKVQPTSRGHFQCVGGPWYAPPQIPPEAPGTKVKAKEGRMGTWFRGKGHTSPAAPLLFADITHTTPCPPGRKVPGEGGGIHPDFQKLTSLGFK